MELMEHQKDAIQHLGSGKVLYGGVGSGKTATAIGYYVEKEAPRDIYVITTAKKRDSLDWQREAAGFAISDDPDISFYGTLHVDSWNNIKNYVEVEDAFFIFDEQRLVGHGAWVKAFLKIAKRNRWILLSATPGDVWLDYAPVFIANGFYKNITEFKRRHVIYEPYVKFPKVKGYLQEKRLERLRNEVLVEMPYTKHTDRVVNYLDVSYDKDLFNKVWKERWHIFEDRPIKDAAELFRVIRKIVNSDPSRLEMVRKLLRCHPKMIIFYNFNYELDLLRELSDEVEVAEWNGHQKDPIPDSDRWVYLVQYVAGSEGWNCVQTDATVFYSLTYSYKNFEQAKGRIDRLDTPFESLFYYVLASNSVIDRAILKNLGEKRNFNERELLRNLSDMGSSSGEVEEEHVEFCQI